MKFSIIIPVYNVEKYLEKCLKSILNQSYDNYEVIIIDDGSTDKSFKIIDKYCNKDKRFTCYKRENSGVSAARNYGLNKVTGDYIIFIDSDDYIEKDLLKKLDESLTKNKVDVIKYGCKVVDDNKNILSTVENENIENVLVINLIEQLVSKKYFDTVWSYSYKTTFWKKNRFLFAEGKIHEDFDFLLLIFYYANTMSIINYNGYNYVQRENSLMSDKNYEKIVKSTNDYLSLYINDYEILSKEKDNLKKKVLLTYGAECVIYASRMLKDKDFISYVKKLKKNKIANKMYSYNKKKSIKKLVAILNVRLYNKLFGRN